MKDNDGDEQMESGNSDMGRHQIIGGRENLLLVNLGSRFQQQIQMQFF